MPTNSQLSTTEHKKENENKLSTQLYQEKSHRNGAHLEGYHGEGRWENGGKGTGSKKCKWQVQNRQEQVKGNMGNGEGKETLYV